MKCILCDNKDWKNKDALRRHANKKHNISDFGMKCTDCNQPFYSLNDYNLHITKWKCPYCQHLCNQKRLLKKHILQKHVTKTHQCQECNTLFSSVSALDSHKKRVHGVHLTKCKLCGKIFTEDALKPHIRSVHVAHKETEYPCNICNKVYKSYNGLDRHKKVHTEAPNQYECDICHKMFAQNATMQRHKRIHLNIKPFLCDVCGTRFTQSTGMKSHRKTHFHKDGTLKSDKVPDQLLKIRGLKTENVNISVAKKSRKKKKSYYQ